MDEVARAGDVPTRLCRKEEVRSLVFARLTRTRIINIMERSLTPRVVWAGFPSPGENWRENPLHLSQLLGLAAENSFCVLMPSIAMSGAGIMRHDLLLASPTLEAANNDVVIASVNEWRGIRRLLLTVGVTFLVPENPNEPTRPRIIVMPGDSFRVYGVVLCSIHPLNVAARHKLRQTKTTVDLNRLLGLDQPEIFVTRVKGISMRLAGIYDGDVLIVSRTDTAAENDIIIASYDGVFYVKRLLQVRGSVFLLSDNPLQPPLVVTAANTFQVWGVVLFTLHPVHELVKNKLIKPRQQPS